MQKWEYVVARQTDRHVEAAGGPNLPEPCSNMEEMLGHLGARGWELVWVTVDSADRATGYLKRPMAAKGPGIYG